MKSASTDVETILYQGSRLGWWVYESYFIGGNKRNAGFTWNMLVKLLPESMIVDVKVWEVPFYSRRMEGQWDSCLQLINNGVVHHNLHEVYFYF